MLLIKVKDIDLLNKTQNFLLRFFVILILASFLTFSGITLFFYIIISSYLSNSILFHHLKSFIIIACSMLFIFDISISFVFYQLLRSYNRHQDNMRYLIELFLEIISHKFGNFLSGVKVNLSLIDHQDLSFPPQVYQRLIKSVDYMESELLTILSKLKTLREYNDILEEAELTVNKLLNNQIKKMECLSENKHNLQLIVKNRCDCLKRIEYSLAIELLLENAFKYAHSTIKIRTGHCKRCTHYFFILNDISNRTQKGLGLGLSIVDFIAKQNGLYIQWQQKDNLFKALIYKPTS